jgi:hypothetical protein
MEPTTTIQKQDHGFDGKNPHTNAIPTFPQKLYSSYDERKPASTKCHVRTNFITAMPKNNSADIFHHVKYIMYQTHPNELSWISLAFSLKVYMYKRYNCKIVRMENHNYRSYTNVILFLPF